MGVMTSRGEAQGSEGSDKERLNSLLDIHFAQKQFYDDSLCRHNYKLYSSKIFSQGKMQQERESQRREAAMERSSGGHERRRGALSSNASLRSNSSANLGKWRTDSQISSEADPWGWFDDMEDAISTDGIGLVSPHFPSKGLGGELGDSRAALAEGDRVGGGPEGPVKGVPPYVLTESLSSQHLWHQTAGKRPRQPSREREYFEAVWKEGMKNSEVDYTQELPERPQAQKRRKFKKKVLHRAPSPFGSAVSKSFKCEKCGGISSIMVHIPKFQIAQIGSEVFAEYLVVIGLGSVSLGVWRRFSEFNRLAAKISNSEKHRVQFHNALCSWKCLKNRQRWFRCLDRDYLILKTFLLERFLHDLVFESMSPDTIREFLGVL